MKIDDLRALVAFAEQGSVSRAAQALHISQPALTRRIQRLESSMGHELLDRSSNPPRLSAFGIRVCERARAVLRETASLRDLAEGGGEPKGTLRIGAVQSISDAVSVDAVRVLKQRFARLQLEMRSDLSVELIRKVQHGELDAAAVMLPTGAPLPPNLVGTRIGIQRVSVVSGRRYPIASTVTLAQLANHSWVLYSAGSCVCRLALQRALEQQGYELRVAVSEHGLEHQLALVSAGAGLGCATEAALCNSRHRNKLRRIQVKELDLRFEVWAIQPLHTGPLATPIRHFVELVAKHFGPRSLRRD